MAQRDNKQIIHESKPPQQLREHPKMGIIRKSFCEFEALMTSLGYRNSERAAFAETQVL